MSEVPLRLTETGPGARDAIIEYVTDVLTQRTAVNPDTNPGRLARGLVTSILHRLGSGYTAAVGGAVNEQEPEGALYLVAGEAGLVT